VTNFEARIQQPVYPVLGLVMAAGYSRRFGSDDKRKALWPATGRTLLGQTLYQLQQVLDLVVVVIRPHDHPQALGVPDSCGIIRAEHAEYGLGASIADAFGVIQNSVNWQSLHSVALMLGDMPTIQPASIQQLLIRAGEQQIVRPTYRGEPGHPVIFGKAYWPSLATELRQHLENGARTIIRQNRQHLVYLAVDDPGVIQDIDTPMALQDKHKSGTTRYHHDPKS
jgi:molybdenum cofactor cytidylyltransferase